MDIIVDGERVTLSPEEAKDYIAPITVEIAEYSLPAFDFWSRMTDAEADMFMASKEAADAKFKGQFDSSVSFVSTSDFFPKLKARLASLLSLTRAEEIMKHE
ncbi:hypothetical protein D3C87_626140 [compost metagenome]